MTAATRGKARLMDGRIGEGTWLRAG
jgi:hypothetical protein